MKLNSFIIHSKYVQSTLNSIIDTLPLTLKLHQPFKFNKYGLKLSTSLLSTFKVICSKYIQSIRTPNSIINTLILIHSKSTKMCICYEYDQRYDHFGLVWKLPISLLSNNWLSIYCLMTTYLLPNYWLPFYCTAFE